MRNDYVVKGDTVVISLRRKNGEIVEAYTSKKFLNKLHWFPGRFRYHKGKHSPTAYVQGRYKLDGKPIEISLHRYVMGVTDPKIDVDHMDHNGLNNREDNLRVCKHKENTQNKQAYKNNVTGIRGVTKTKNGYRVTVQSGGKTLLDRRVKDLDYAIKLAEETRKKVFPFSQENAYTALEQARA